MFMAWYSVITFIFRQWFHILSFFFRGENEAQQRKFIRKFALSGKLIKDKCQVQDLISEETLVYEQNRF